MRIGIDLGGTKIEGIALEDDGRERARLRISTPHDYIATLEAIADLVQRLERAAGATGPVGIGIPGTMSPATGLVKNANSTWLIGHPLDRDLAARLARPVRVANDANCFALSEAVDGAGAFDPTAPIVRAGGPDVDHGPRVVFGVIIGTGTGGGVVVGGQVLIGPNAIAGEWGHNPLPGIRSDELPGPECYCGRRACIETFLSGPGMAHDHERATGVLLDAATIVQNAQDGDAAAEATLVRYEDRMARALASILNVLDPDVIVLGGGLSKIQRLYTNVPKLWGRYSFSDSMTTQLVPPKHGDASGVRGAAWLWPQPQSSSQSLRPRP
jgi:fructokinase